MTTPPYRDRLRLKALAIAARIAASEGLAALQARRIATEAGCSVGSLYNVFGDMDGLVVAVNRETVRLLGDALMASFAASEESQVEQRLMQLALTYMHFALDHQNRWRAVFEHRQPDGREVPADYRADQARLLGLIEAVIAGDVTDSSLRRHAARALFAAIHGIIMLALDEKLAHFDREAMESEIRFIVSAAAHGLARART